MTVTDRRAVALAKTLFVCAFALGLVASAFGASGRRAAPAEAPAGAPSELTSFSDAELTRGFMALAFGSDMRLGRKSAGIRKFDRGISVGIAAGAGPRADRYRGVIEELSSKVPALDAKVVADTERADVLVWLIDEKDFVPAMTSAFGQKIARAFVRKTDPQCMTQTQSKPDGKIEHANVFVIVDQGEDVFLNCAYHETLHALGLLNHADANPWTTLNQNRSVGYLTVYDRLLLTILYDPAAKPGMTKAEIKRVLPGIVRKINAAEQGQPANTER